MRRRVRRSRPAARPSSASGGSSTVLSPTAWRKPVIASSPLLVCRRASGEAREQRMRSTSLFCCAICYCGGARVTAWQRAGIEDVSPAAQPSPSLLIAGTRAPLTRTTRLPSADKLFVGMFSVAHDIDLPVAQFLDVVGIGRATLVALL